MDITIDSVVARWSDPVSRPLFKGRLIDISADGDVCRCAQGEILHLAGWDDERLEQLAGRPLVFLPMFGLTISGLSDAA